MKLKEMIEELAKARETGIDYEHTDEITCPYCGSRWLDSWEYMSGEEDLGEYTCGECEKTYLIKRNIRIDYSTQTMEEKKFWDNYSKKEGENNK